MLAPRLLASWAGWRCKGCHPGKGLLAGPTLEAKAWQGCWRDPGEGREVLGAPRAFSALGLCIPDAKPLDRRSTVLQSSQEPWDFGEVPPLERWKRARLVPGLIWVFRNSINSDICVDLFEKFILMLKIES